MACVEEIFRFTLEELAANGNEQAKLALAMAGRLAKPLPDNSAAIRELQEAQSDLADALSKNDRKWTTATDDYIHKANARITNAIVKMR
jgi:hypothetical protein